jgi:non-heme chloroperoxidase
VWQTIVDYELEQVERANEKGLQPVVFVHGLWLLPSSWYNWVRHFEEAGYTALAPGWPDDPETDAAANAEQIADYYGNIVRKLDTKPAIVGHSLGGLFAEILARRGLAAASIAISPAPARGVLPLPISALKSAWPVVQNPANRNRAIPLTYDQFRYAFANAVGEDEAQKLYETYAVPAAGTPLFASAAANFNPWTEAKFENDDDRGPLLVIAGEKDHTVPAAVAQAAFELESTNISPTEYLEMPGRGHSLTIDRGWQDVADVALRFAQRFAPAT